MKRTAVFVALVAFVAGIAGPRPAAAGEPYSCCDLAVRGGACIAQPAPCDAPASYAAALSFPPASASAEWPLLPGYAGASFPAGVDGYLAMTVAAPRVGFCLDAPSAQDPEHAGPTEPVACLALSMAPGVSAQQAVVTVPADPRWDAYQLCYGAPSGTLDGGTSCLNPNDANDPTVSPTPGSGSCCAPAHPLIDGTIVASQEIPGVPPPVIIYGADGGITTFYDADAGGRLATAPDACLDEYNEPAGCGQPGDAAAPQGGACKPLSCGSVAGACGLVPDGCGGTLHCQDCSSLAKGTFSCSASAASGEATTPLCSALLFGVALLGASRRRRVRRGE